MQSQGQDFYYRSDDGLQLYCRIFPCVETHDGGEDHAVPTVICLPGLTRNSRDFIELATHLQKKYRVLAPDLRGRGRSAYDPHWENYQPNSYCADIAALLRAQQVRSASIIGTSLGALLAMLLAFQYPAIIRGIVLNDAGPEIDPAGARRIAGYVGKQVRVSSWEDAAAQARNTYAAALPGLTDDQWLDYTRQSYREREDGIPVADSDPNIGLLFRTGEATPQTLWPVFAQLKTLPMLVIRGAMSDILSAATVERMAREKPDLRQLTIADRGHAPLLNEPGCVAAIDDFLRTHVA
jgi:pimeloyl-ACP methyl ester carboxylesterase